MDVYDPSQLSLSLLSLPIPRRLLPRVPIAIEAVPILREVLPLLRPPPRRPSSRHGLLVALGVGVDHKKGDGDVRLVVTLLRQAQQRDGEHVGMPGMGTHDRTDPVDDDDNDG